VHADDELQAIAFQKLALGFIGIEVGGPSHESSIGLNRNMLPISPDVDGPQDRFRYASRNFDYKVGPEKGERIEVLTLRPWLDDVWTSDSGANSSCMHKFGVAASDNALRIEGRDAKSVVTLLAFEFECEEVSQILVQYLCFLTKEEQQG
jgi:hypothetical protein